MINPTEHQEQVIVVNWLRARGRMVFAVPNAGKRRSAAALKAEGMVKGASDLIIILNHGGVVLEMKAIDGRKPTKEQTEFLNAADLRAGWTALVGVGAQDAINQLEKLGI